MSLAPSPGEFSNPVSETFDVDTGSPGARVSPGAGGSAGLGRHRSVLQEEEEEQGDLVGVKELAKMGMGIGKLGLGIGRGATQIATATAMTGLGMTGIKQNSKLGSAELKELFDSIDVDGNGDMDRLELRQMVQGLGVRLREKELDEVMLELCLGSRESEAADQDVDVSELRVTFEQFEQWWKKNIENANSIGGATSNFAKLLIGDTDQEQTDPQTLVVRATWVDPEKPFKRLWETYIILVLLYVGVTLPYRVAFEATPQGGYYIVAVVYECSLLADVVINARTAFEVTTEHGSELVTATLPMFKQYMFKRMGWVDVIGSFPFQTLRIEERMQGMKSLQLLRLCQVLRLVKVIRAIKQIQTAFFKVVNDTFGGVSVSVSLYALRMVKLVTLLATVAHVSACGWYYVGKPDVGELESFDDFGIGIGLEHDGWVMRYYPDKKDDKLFLYLHSFYFVQTTMTTVGYGDIGPKRTIEVIFAMLVQVTGCAIFGYVVGLMGSAVSGFEPHEGPMSEKLEFLEALMVRCIVTS